MYDAHADQIVIGLFGALVHLHLVAHDDRLSGYHYRGYVGPGEIEYPIAIATDTPIRRSGTAAFAAVFLSPLRILRLLIEMLEDDRPGLRGETSHSSHSNTVAPR